MAKSLFHPLWCAASEDVAKCLRIGHLATHNPNAWAVLDIDHTGTDKFIPLNNMKEYGWSRCIAPLISNLTTRWKWVVKFTLPPIHPWGKNIWHPLNRRLGGPTASLDMLQKTQKNIFLRVIKHQIIQPVAQSLYWLSCPKVWPQHIKMLLDSNTRHYRGNELNKTVQVHISESVVITWLHNTQILFWLVCIVIQNINLENDATLSVIKPISTFADLSPTDDIVCFTGCCHAWRRENECWCGTEWNGCSNKYRQ